MPAPRFSLGKMAALCAVLFALTTFLVNSSGLKMVPPWPFLIALCVIGLPFSISIHRFSRINWTPATSVENWLLAAAVAALVLMYGQSGLVWPVLLAVLFVLPSTRPKVAHGKLLLLTAVVLFCGYGVVWNLNYLLMRYMPLGRWDPLLRDMDLAVYSLFSGPMSSLTGYFPLVRDKFLLGIFDSAYTMLNPEILLVAFVLVQERDAATVTRFLQKLFTFYLAGIAIYLVFPVNGPHLYYPEQQVLSLLPPSAAILCEGMMHDYQVAKTGGQLAGFGYFIGFPSLHILMALFLQHTLMPFRTLFRVFLPINIVLSMSTIVLGYHYLFDIAGAVLVYAFALVWQGWRPGHSLSLAPARPIIET